MKLENLMRERIWYAVKILIKDKTEVLKNNLIDTVIINVFYKVVNLDREEEVLSFNDALCK